MSTEGRTISFGTISRWMMIVWAPGSVAFFAILVFASPEIPELAYMLTDPVGLPVMAISMAVMVLMPGWFVGYPFTPRPAAGEKAPSGKWAIRVPLALMCALSLVAMRPVVIREATPTREAVALMKKHAVAGKKIGNPVEVGWHARGFIHASGQENDEPMPARIDASVDVSGPKGSGTLFIEGQAAGGKWVFSHVWLTLDKGRERIEIAGAPAPPPVTKGESGLDGTAIAVVIVSVLFALLIAGVVVGALRSSDPARAIATMPVSSGVPFSLRFSPKGEKGYHVWLRFEVDYDGGEDDYGLTAELRMEVPGSAPFAVEHRIGDKAPQLGASGTRNTSLYRGTSSSGPAGASIRATAEITSVPVPNAVGEVVFTGRVVVAEGQKAVDLLVFVVPK